MLLTPTARSIHWILTAAPKSIEQQTQEAQQKGLKVPPIGTVPIDTGQLDLAETVGVYATMAIGFFNVGERSGCLYAAAVFLSGLIMQELRAQPWAAARSGEILGLLFQPGFFRPESWESFKDRMTGPG